MNVKNLPLKFGFVAILIALCTMAVRCNGLKEGIDLNGGSIVIFAVNTPQAEIDKFEAQKKDLEAELSKPGLTPEQQADKNTQIKGLDEQIKSNRRIISESTGNLAEEIIAILKKRVDPNGLYSLEWLPMGSSRIQVRMPAGQDESRKAKEVYNRAMREAENHNISRSQVLQLEQAPAADRPGIIRKNLKITETQARNLIKLVEDHDAFLKSQEQLPALRAKVREAEKAVLTTRPTTQPSNDSKVQEARKALEQAENEVANRDVAYRSLQRKIQESNINEQGMQAILRNFVSSQERSVLSKTSGGELSRREDAYSQGLRKLEKQYADRVEDLQPLTTISTLASDNSINDSAGSLPLIPAGLSVWLDRDKNTGNGRRGTVVSSTPGKIVVKGLKLVDQPAGTPLVISFNKDITTVVIAYEAWSNGRKRLDDPSDLVRLIRKAGVLEFRMAPYLPNAQGGTAYSLPQSEVDSYRQKLQREGPDPGRKRNDLYQWFPLHDENEGMGGVVTDPWGGRTYVLLSNNTSSNSNDTMLNPPGRNTWRLTDAYSTRDDMGKPAVGFKFDQNGASIFGRLTDAHKPAPGARQGDHMAVLLDDEIYSAPTINAVITDSGIIQGRFTEQEVLDLVNTFKAGSLPARLNPDPVSISSFGSAMGEINKKMSFKAGIIALVAVAAFMLIYYLLSGVIADLALAFNIVLILGAMAAFGAVFTMPGIAGLILTIGMAVDSNVLINERLREEQERGLPIRLAFKNAYDRAFSAIFDSHLTALITCLVLYWVGTEEVKGFAVTLGLGVAFNLFTAVFVTKWVVMVMLNTGMIRSHQYMLRLIHVPKIDWMAKRYYFWGFSLITAVLGIVALASEGGRIWGIEFSAGTQATLVFKPDGMVTVDGKTALLNDRTVADLFTNTAREMAAARAGVDRTVLTAQKRDLEAKLSQPGTDAQAKDDLQKTIAKIDDQLRDFSTLRDNSRVETVLDPDKVEKFMKIYNSNYNSSQQDNKVTREQWKAANGNPEFFAKVDTNNNNVLEQAELEKSLPPVAYRVNTTETNLDMIREVAAKAFGQALANRQRITYHLADPAEPGEYAKLGVTPGSGGRTIISMSGTEKENEFKNAKAGYRDHFEDFDGGVLLVIDKLQPAVTRQELEQRLDAMRVQPDESLASQATNPVRFIGLTPAEEGKFSSFAILARSGDLTAVATTEAKVRFAENEAKLMNEVLHREDSMTATHIDSQVAGQTKQRAMVAVVLSWLAIIAYLWLRFGSASWGFAAVICLVHDTIIVVGMVAVSDWISQTAIGQALLVGSFKIDLAMIAALLTIIGYSVSDTIVVFDRIRENRGKLKTVSYQVINNSINQTLSRTILTVFVVFLVVVVMYIWGGESIRGFNYALLVGIFFGCYSSIAVAAPILMGFKQMVAAKALAVTEAPSEPKPGTTPQGK